MFGRRKPVSKKVPPKSDLAVETNAQVTAALDRLDSGAERVHVISARLRAVATDMNDILAVCKSVKE